jgi:hypothetical protein
LARKRSMPRDVADEAVQEALLQLNAAGVVEPAA